jgi:hypothetical protein
MWESYGHGHETNVQQEIAGEPQRLPLSQVLTDYSDCSAGGSRVAPMRTPGFRRGSWLVPSRAAT